MSLFGQPSIRVDDDQTDRIGIRTLIMSKLWAPREWDPENPSYEDDTPATPTVTAGMIYVARQTSPTPGGMRTKWTFEGIDGDGKSVTFKDRTNSIDYQFDPGFSTVSILQHPRIKSLLENYGGNVVDGQVVWAPTVIEGNAGMSIERNGVPNPLFGIQEFLRLEGIYTFRYAEFKPTAALNGVGNIYDSGNLPGEAPRYSGRNWLKAPSPFRRRGPVYDITEIYWLSGPGGWPRPLYGAGSQL